MTRGAKAFVKLSALKHNLSRVRELVKQSRVMAMIKSNGYGHGMIEVANALSDADAFGVASVTEAITLRDANIKQPIVVMSGFYDVAELPLLVEHNLQAVIHDPSQLDMLCATSLSSPVTVWLKIDTGMHRLGFLPDAVSDARERLRACEWVDKPIHLMTHLADADRFDSDFTTAQIDAFSELTNEYPGPKSIANSGGILAYSGSHADWVRPGIMLFGASPFEGRVGIDEQLQPVMTLQAKIMAVKTLEKNDAIGYGCTWRCPEAMPIAIVAIGYGDGYPRHAPSGTPTLVNGVECPIVGRVSMDMLAIDLRAQPNAQIGDTVTLWGDDLPVERIAECADTISYELMCDLTPRVRREYV